MAKNLNIDVRIPYEWAVAFSKKTYAPDPKPVKPKKGKK